MESAQPAKKQYTDSSYKKNHNNAASKPDSNKKTDRDAGSLRITELGETQKMTKGWKGLNHTEDEYRNKKQEMQNQAKKLEAEAAEAAIDESKRGESKRSEQKPPHPSTIDTSFTMQRLFIQTTTNTDCTTSGGWKDFTDQLLYAMRCVPVWFSSLLLVFCPGFCPSHFYSCTPILIPIPHPRFSFRSSPRYLSHLYYSTSFLIPILHLHFLLPTLHLSALSLFRVFLQSGSSFISSVFISYFCSSFFGSCPTTVPTFWIQ